MNTSPEESLLGKPATYASHYDRSLLYPMDRQPKRDELGICDGLPFFGYDLWTAYELSWLNPRGKPEVAIARFTVPATSTHIVESKSLKLYLNSFSNTCFDDSTAVAQQIQTDLSQAFWHGSVVDTSVCVDLSPPDAWHREALAPLDGVLLDTLDIACTHYVPSAELLSMDAGRPPVTEALVSHLLKSNCLVTGQPDWGSVAIRYTGQPIDHAGLLGYLVSFRNHNEFHEQCVERIFMDIFRRCQPTRLEVFARYTRRGGLDINPWRSTHPGPPPANVRTARQ